MNIYEIIRRLQSGHTISTIAKTLNLDRKTVRRYIKSAQTVEIERETALPEEADLLAKLQSISPLVFA